MELYGNLTLVNFVFYTATILLVKGWLHRLNHLGAHSFHLESSARQPIMLSGDTKKSFPLH